MRVKNEGAGKRVFRVILAIAGLIAALFLASVFALTAYAAPEDGGAGSGGAIGDILIPAVTPEPADETGTSPVIPPIVPPTFPDFPPIVPPAAPEVPPIVPPAAPEFPPGGPESSFEQPVLPGWGTEAEQGAPDTEPPEFEPLTLTPPGNLTLVDDISGRQSDDKQFITVITKSGAYFYIIIDRAGDRQNVHFLNLVDEADLMAIMENDRKPAAAPAPIEPLPEQPRAPDPDPGPVKKNTISLAAIVVSVVILVAGLVYYFKVARSKKGAKASSAPELDGFDFDADEDDLIFEGAGSGQMTAGGGAGGPDGVYDPDAAYDSSVGQADAVAPVPYDTDLQDSEYSDAYTYESFVNDETQD